jgi:transposase-like protein
MSKLVTGSRPCEVAAQSALATIQIPLPLASVLMDAKQGLLDLVVSTGLQVFEAMLEQDREALCGPKWKRMPERSATRAGRTRGEVTLGGRRIVLQRPRVRSATAGELTLPSFAFAAERDPLDARTLEAIALGVSNRDYRRSLDAVPESLDERSVSRSAVSRRFVALSAQQLTAWMSQPLGDLDLRVVQIDGIHFHEHVVLIALGIDAEGQKHVLGLREGTTENATVVRALLSDLVDRGLSPDRPLLFAIDGAKALRKALTAVFGSSAIVQRCQVHKRRNVLEHLPERMRPSVRKAMQQAYDTEDVALARRQLERLAKSLERAHPGAAASLREGLEETLTLQRLGITGALYRTLRSTNPIENLNGLLGRFTRNVKRWRDGSMIVRWIAAGIFEAKRRFRRIRGHRDLETLFAAITRHAEGRTLDLEKRVA